MGIVKKMEKYNPKEHELIICEFCGNVFDKLICMSHERDENDCKIAFIECPCCEFRVQVDYNY